VVSSVRKRWYGNYLVAMESLTTCVLEKAQEAREEGRELPYAGDIRAQADAFRSGATAKLGGDAATAVTAFTAATVGAAAGASAFGASSTASEGGVS